MLSVLINVMGPMGGLSHDEFGHVWFQGFGGMTRRVADGVSKSIRIMQWGGLDPLPTDCQPEGYCYLPIHAITNQKGKRHLACEKTDEQVLSDTSKTRSRDI